MVCVYMEAKTLMRDLLVKIVVLLGCAALPAAWSADKEMPKPVAKPAATPVKTESTGTKVEIGKFRFHRHGEEFDRLVLEFKGTTAKPPVVKASVSADK